MIVQKNETLQSYLGLLKHGNTHKLQEELLNEYWIWQDHERKSM